MALFINCPGCGQRIVNNGANCPWCDYNVKEGKSKEEIEQELMAAEEARAAEAAAEQERLAAEEQARIAAEQARIAEEQARAAEAARLAAEARAAEQARLAAEQQARAAAAQRAAQQAQGSSNIFAQFRQKTTAREPQVDLADRVTDMDNLPYMPDGSSDGALPPMQLDKPVSVATIANTPAFKLDPLAQEKETSVLPPMQLEREVTMEDIANTPSVQLSPIQGEVISDALPDFGVSAGVEPQMPFQSAAPSPFESEPVPDAVQQTPMRPVQPFEIEQPAPRMPQPPVQQPVPQRPVVQEQPAPRMPQPPVQQPVPQRPVVQEQPAPRMPQPPVQQPVPQRPVVQEQPAPRMPQQPVQQPAPQRRPRAQRQWSSNPSDFSNNAPQVQPPVQQRPVPQQRPAPQQPPMQQRPAPQQPPMQQRPMPQQPPMQQRPAQPGPRQQRPQRPQRQWSSNPGDFGGQPKSSKVELQPIEQEVTEVTATGERLQNLPPQQAPSDPNFDTDSYVRNLHRQIKEDQKVETHVDTQREIIRQAEKVQVQPMKFDGKQLRAQNVDVVKAPREKNKTLAPIIIVVILVLALVGIAVYIFFFSDIFKEKDFSIKLKADSWGDEVYAVYFNDPKDIVNANISTSEAREKYKMTKESDGTYSIKLDNSYDGGYVIFINAEGNVAKSTYPSLNGSGLKITKDKTYEVVADKTTSSPSK